jgi:hypothetical protein
MSTPVSTFLLRLLKFCLKTALILAVLSGATAVYGEFKLRKAKRQVESFSQQVIVGQPVAVLESKAGEMHLNYRHIGSGGGKDGTFLAWEGFLFERWFCNVEYRDGKVTAKKVTSMD